MHAPIQELDAPRPAPRWRSELFTAAAAAKGEIAVELRTFGPAPGPRQG